MEVVLPPLGRKTDESECDTQRRHNPVPIPSRPVPRDKRDGTGHSFKTMKKCGIGDSISKKIILHRFFRYCIIAILFICVHASL